MFENLSDRLQGIFSGLKSKGRLTEDDINAAMREIRMALLEADVNFKVVKSFIANAKERCLTAEVLDSLTPAQNVVKIVLDELTALLGQTDSGLVLSSRIPNVIMLVGLQGSGKTTAAAKLAYLLKGKGHSPLLVACDVYRPAAADQLQTLGDEMGVKVYRGDGQDPVKIASEGVRFAIDNLRDVVIVDTAGRLHVDEEMMEEAANIKAAVKPDQILMVVDAMTGQDAVNVAQAFAETRRFRRRDYVEDGRRRPWRRRAVAQAGHRQAHQVHQRRREARFARAVPSRPHGQAHFGHGRCGFAY